MLYRIFNGYREPSRINPTLLCRYELEMLTTFGNSFQRNYGAPCTIAMLGILLTNHHFVSPHEANLALLFLGMAVSMRITYKVDIPSMQALINHVICPYICITDTGRIT